MCLPCVIRVLAEAGERIFGVPYWEKFAFSCKELRNRENREFPCAMRSLCVAGISIYTVRQRYDHYYCFLDMQNDPPNAYNHYSFTLQHPSPSPTHASFLTASRPVILLLRSGRTHSINSIRCQGSFLARLSPHQTRHG
jgi:hypothetical protein